ncbi:hypothetical protein AA313_de0207647 [Arthrobotrys entomopaga]|nr:hypothetical protein AA313_de0207647 [Arthrobotrys entomopaga]
MRATFFIVTAAAFASATPLPQFVGKLATGAVNTIGLACAFQQEQCQNIGDAFKKGIGRTTGRPVSGGELDKILKGGLGPAVSGWGK